MCSYSGYLKFPRKIFPLLLPLRPCTRPCARAHNALWMVILPLTSSFLALLMRTYSMFNKLSVYRRQWHEYSFLDNILSIYHLYQNTFAPRKVEWEHSWKSSECELFLIFRDCSVVQCGNMATRTTTRSRCDLKCGALLQNVAAVLFSPSHPSE